MMRVVLSYEVHQVGYADHLFQARMQGLMFQYSRRQVFNFFYELFTRFPELAKQIGYRARIMIRFMRFLVAHIGSFQLCEPFPKLLHARFVQRFEVGQMADVLLRRPLAVNLLAQLRVSYSCSKLGYARGRCPQALKHKRQVSRLKPEVKLPLRPF